MEEPKSKKVKTEIKEDDEDEAEQIQMDRNEHGESFCELSKTRRLTVRKFKSSILIDVREVCVCVCGE